MALSIVLLDDRFPEGRFVLLAPILTATLEIIAPHGRENARRLLAAHEIRAFGHIQTNRGLNARPHMP